MRWSNPSVGEAFDEYCATLRDPFDLLRNGRSKTALIEAITSSSPATRQPTLFDTGDDPETLLEEMHELNDKRILYRQWSQEIGSKVRQLSTPHPRFGIFLEQYVVPLIRTIPAQPQAHGGEPRWSPKTSLQTHLPCETVLSFDLESAFSHIGVRDAFDFFYTTLTDLDPNTRKECAGFLAMISTTTYNDRRSLPQGAPHSMALFNRALSSLDVTLEHGAKERGLTYTRWVDDITLSSPEDRDPRDLLGAVALTAQETPVAQHKIFLQQADDGPVYLLGHRIERGTIYKNSPKDREANKAKPLDYGKWFDNERRYNEW